MSTKEAIARPTDLIQTVDMPQSLYWGRCKYVTDLENNRCIFTIIGTKTGLQRNPSDDARLAIITTIAGRDQLDLLRWDFYELQTHRAYCNRTADLPFRYRVGMYHYHMVEFSIIPSGMQGLDIRLISYQERPCDSQTLELFSQEIGFNPIFAAQAWEHLSEDARCELLKRVAAELHMPLTHYFKSLTQLEFGSVLHSLALKYSWTDHQLLVLAKHLLAIH